MTAVDLVKILGEFGARFTDLDPVLTYCVNMITDERVVIVYEDNKPHSVFFYSITDNEETFLKKGMWEYKKQDPQGKILYVEKMVTKGWNRELRNIFELTVCTKYPQIECGCWHRYGRTGDRKVISKRRVLCTK